MKRYNYQTKGTFYIVPKGNYYHVWLNYYRGTDEVCRTRFATNESNPYYIKHKDGTFSMYCIEYDMYYTCNDDWFVSEINHAILRLRYIAMCNLLDEHLISDILWILKRMDFLKLIQNKQYRI
jgi:hypothetical protein